MLLSAGSGFQTGSALAKAYRGASTDSTEEATRKKAGKNTGTKTRHQGALPQSTLKRYK